MNFEDINFSNKTNYRFRSVYRITLYIRGERSLKVGFNKKEKALEVLSFLENLVKTDSKYIDVEMICKPRRKRRRQACPDLVKLFDPIFNH